jgi:hypothetical protein
MEPVRVPQHLELDDVIAWGLGAVDLACIVGSGVVAWWIWELVPAPFDIRLGMAAPVAVTGLLIGAVRFRDRALREWLLLAAAYVLRSRLLLLAAE